MSAKRVSGAREQGYVLVWFTVMLITLLAITAFAIDVGRWYLTAERARKAADAAAIAAVAYLPADRAGACTAADEEARRNGFPSIFVDAADEANCPLNLAANVRFPEQNQISVKVGDNVTSLFATVVGLRSQAIARGSTAEYNPPLELGSPSNVLGNEPAYTTDDQFDAGGRNQGAARTGNQAINNREWRPTWDAGSGYWLAVNGPATPDDLGQEKNDYQFIVKATSPSPGDKLQIEMYDPNFWSRVTGPACTSWSTSGWWLNAHPPNALTFPNGGLALGNDWGRFRRAQVAPDGAFIPNKWCSGDDDLGASCWQGGGGGGTPWYPGAGLSSKPTFTLPDARAAATARPAGIYLGGDGCSLPDTTVEVYAQDGTPNSVSDNKLISVTECQNTITSYVSGDNPRTFLSGSSMLPNDLYGGFQMRPGAPNWLGNWDLWARGAGWAGMSDSQWMRLVHTWVRLCEIDDPASTAKTVNGEYIVRVRTDGTVIPGVPDPITGERPVTGDSTRTYGKGSNRFALRAQLVDSLNNPIVSAANSASRYVQVFSRNDLPLYVNLNTGSFYMTRIAPGYAGKTIELRLYDPGDSAAGGTMTFAMPPDARQGGSGGPAYGPITGCQYAVDGGIRTMGAMTPDNCTITIPPIDPNATPPTTGWNGRWVTVRIPIPSGYWCDDTVRTNCWYRINFDMGTSGVWDNTVWSAQIVGDPIKLVK